MKKEMSLVRVIILGLALVVAPAVLFTSCWEDLDEVLGRRDLQVKVLSLKTMLINEIHSAQSRHDSEVEGANVGLYAAGAKASLQTEISNAQAVYDDPGSTDNDYSTARSNLGTALSTFDTKKIRHLDVAFVIDTTGSMSSVINDLRVKLSNAITEIKNMNDDAKCAIVRFEEFSSWPGGTLPNGYDVVQELTTNTVDLINAINSLPAANGGDQDEAYVAAMKGTADDLSWTTGSDRIVILITRSPAHHIPSPTHSYPGPDLETSVISVQAVGIKPAGFYYSSMYPETITDLQSFVGTLGGMVYPCDANFLTNFDGVMSGFLSWWL